jgi:hypothetical protein
MLILELQAIQYKQFSVNASCCVNYINLFIETVTTQRFNEVTFVSSSITLLHVSAFHEAIIRFLFKTFTFYCNFMFYIVVF